MSNVLDSTYDREIDSQTFLRKRPVHKKPVRYEDVDFNALKELAQAGYTERQIALALDLTQSSITRWKQRYPEFKDLLQIWKLDADRQVERSLFERATGYVHDEERIYHDKDGKVTRVTVERHYPPDVKACIFWLKNRQKDLWKDKQEIEHSGDGDFAAAIISARKRAGAEEQRERTYDERMERINALLE